MHTYTHMNIKAINKYSCKNNTTQTYKGGKKERKRNEKKKIKVSTKKQTN